MADQFREVNGTPQDLVRQFKDLGTTDPQGRPVFAEVLALEPNSIGSGGGGVASAVAIADGVSSAVKATVTGANALKVDGSAVTQPISAASLPLPTGAATETTLAAVNTKLAGTIAVSGTFWQATQPVSGTFWQATQPISAAALPLPTGAATDSVLQAVRDRLPATLGQKTMANSLPVVISSDQSAIPVSGTFWQATQPVSGTFWQATQPVSGTFWPTAAASPSSARLSDGTAFYDAAKTGQLPSALVSGRLDVNIGASPATVPISAASLPLPTGASTEATLSGISGKLPTTLGQKAMASSLAVVIASDQSAVATKETPATLVGTTISAANTTVTLTLAAAGAGLFHYITSIEIIVTNPTVTAVAAAATNLAFTSTNLGGLAWNAGTALAAGAEKVIARMALNPPLKAAVANTASTIVAPACGAGTLCRIQVTYYTAT